MKNHEVVSQWLDPERVRALAEGLLAPVPGSEITPDESFFGEGFEGFTDELPPVPMILPKEKVVLPAPPLMVPAIEKETTVAKPSVQIDPFRKVEPPAEKNRITEAIKPLPTTSKPVAQEEPTIRSPFKVAPKAVKPSSAEPLGPFRDWLGKQGLIQASFICDQEGKVIFDEVKNEKLLKVTCSLGRAARKKAGGSGSSSLRVRIAEDRGLEILTLDSPPGFFTVGLIVGRPLSEEAREIIVRNFHMSLGRSSAPRE